MRMTKKLIILLTFACFSLVGCQNTSGELLAYEEMKASAGSVFDNQFTEADFFAENLAIITEEDNHGEDPILTSKANLLVNITDNEVIYADHVYDRLYPASLTKLMTALIALQNGELTDTVTISYNASHIAESGAKLCGFHEGDTISLESLLYALLIYSGNDAGTAIAEHVGKSEENFVKMMNEEAKKLGAVHSNFVNAHGLHNDNHYTTAYDLYLIFHQLIQYDTFLSIINTPSYKAVYKDIEGNEKQMTFQTTNQFLNGKADPVPGIEIIGGKTGTTHKAGNCLILLCQDSKHKEYISLILNSPDSDQLYSQMSHMLSSLTE
ncbi:MAG TPA: D-alanyl-D-alanine carboxypeptidase [Lachnospiraceae bacterium]|nr:D-alanyl-D-alanine carboxypeptidase [Lachnospiraceae bacterium]HCM13731.1 D-alanyl-D-alanine carboxypeptidase [Lachnospiraceae bacterium]HCR39632.1 D-alanyl-D-alanine carboxypeptidase [Lachnospiraceae bacterium]